MTTSCRSSLILRASLLGLSLSLLTAPLTTAVYAGAQVTQQVSYNMPAGPLEQSLNQFSRLSGITLSYPPSLVQSQQAPALVGEYAPEQALAILLKDTGLEAVADNGGYRLVSNNPDADSIALETLNVQGQPVIGYLAARSSTATKTDTPILETPQSISVITQTQIRDQGIDSLAEAFRYTPGVQGETFGFNPRSSSITIRGFDAATTGVFRDGLQLRNPTAQQGAFNIEPYGAERIEVLRGPASVLYGQTNPGGIVNFVSKRAPREQLREVEFLAGNFDRYEGRLDIGGPIENTDLAWRMTGLVRDSDTQIDFVEDKRIYFAPTVTWQPTEKTRLTFLANFQDDKTEDFQSLPTAGTVGSNPNGRLPASRFTGEPDFDQIDRTEYGLGYQFEHAMNDAWTLRQNLRYGRSELDRAVVFGLGLQPDQRTLSRGAFTNDKDLDTFTLDNQAQVKFATGSVDHSLLFGLDYQRTDVDNVLGFGGAPDIDIFDPVYGAPVPTPAVFSDAEIELEQAGLYVQEQLKFREQWVLQLGGRYDWASNEIVDSVSGTDLDQNDNEFTFRTGLVYLADNGLSPYISYSESFLPVAATNFFGDPFEPETGEQYEVGVKYQPPGSNSFMTAAVFDLRRQNVRTTDPDNVQNQVQTGEIRSRGLELEGVASLDSGLEFIAAYTYLDVDVTKSNVPGEKGERLSQIPEHQASVWTKYTFREDALRGLSLGAGVRYTGTTFADTPNTFKVPAFTVVDARLQYDWQEFQFALDATNIFDEEGFVCFGGGGSFCSYGAQRTVVGSVRYRF